MHDYHFLSLCCCPALLRFAAADDGDSEAPPAVAPGVESPSLARGVSGVSLTAGVPAALPKGVVMPPGAVGQPFRLPSFPLKK